jgi:hypothetical protein
MAIMASARAWAQVSAKTSRTVVPFSMKAWAEPLREALQNALFPRSGTASLAGRLIVICLNASDGFASGGTAHDKRIFATPFDVAFSSVVVHSSNVPTSTGVNGRSPLFIILLACSSVISEQARTLPLFTITTERFLLLEFPALLLPPGTGPDVADVIFAPDGSSPLGTAARWTDPLHAAVIATTNSSSTAR